MCSIISLLKNKTVRKIEKSNKGVGAAAAIIVAATVRNWKWENADSLVATAAKNHTRCSG